jgi:large subunit ribosomal protein L10
MSRILKRTMADELTVKFSGMKECILVDLTGISAGDASGLRARLRADRIHMNVLNNSVASLAFEELKLSDVKKLLSGPSTVIYGGDDIVIMAKALQEWIKKNKPILIKGGYMTGLVLGPDDVKKLALVPSKKELQAQVVGMIASPLRGLVTVLNANLVKLVMTVKAVGEKKT